MTPKQVHLIAATHSTGSHLRGWRHPDMPARPAIDLHAFVEAVQELERGLFDAVFLGETTGVMPGPADAHQRDSMVNDSLDPTVLLAAVAATTHRIGLITTASTSLTRPRSLARILASLDHLSNGRAGWNVVTSRFPTEARNFGLDPDVLRSPGRYDIAEAFLEEATRSWAVRPVILQAGSSEAGRDFSARHADLVLVPGDAGHARSTRADIRRRAAAHGRDPDSVLALGVLPSVLVAETPAEANALLQEFVAFLDPMERAHHGIIAAPPAAIVDLMEDWLDAGAVDGFALGFPYLQGPVQAFTRLVVPELQRRGRLGTTYPGTTLRDHLGLQLDRP